MAPRGVDDKQQIGLTAETDEKLKNIAEKYFGGREADVYRFAIAFAIAADLDAESASGKFDTKFNAMGTLDIDQRIRNLLTVLHVGDQERPYATAERLAEAGVIEMARRLDSGASFADLFEINPAG